MIHIVSKAISNKKFNLFNGYELRIRTPLIKYKNLKPLSENV